jgi:pSer/pThr/pTyr-binding forkhead associated (FHA) protein
MPNLLKVRVSLKGRPIRTYTFNKKSVSIGRDPMSDIFLDNTGISRSHARIERTPGGYVVQDLGSANGTFLNDAPVRREYIGHDDVVRIGKFALWMGVESDRRDRALAQTPGPGAFEGTTVLSPDQLLFMQQKAKKQEIETPGEKPPRPSAPATPTIGRAGTITAMGAAFLLGLFVGAACTLMYLGG